MFLAVSLVPMIGAIGLAVDSSLGHLLKTRMGKSLDAAGLAAGRMALDDDVEATVEAFFLANFGESDTIEVDDFAIDIDENNHFVTLTATATAHDPRHRRAGSRWRSCSSSARASRRR